ncbi:hypothetical protein JCGZ_06539 [Jatropha curcas]|uniref:Uncharacterized protein n=1 Tax=Jatropha curcas TaxID=180498 RepID=A0A067LE78_JATCU|nr:hypothetical protein JCGZ_06539 [Jatropha curcas]
MAFSTYIVTVSLLLVSLTLLPPSEALHNYDLQISVNEALVPSDAAAPAPAASGSRQSIDCGEACKCRCKLSKRPNLCKQSCGSCCAKCNCVPQGTYGNLEFCPCYAYHTTRNHTFKCP